jgi:hypothetical protein
LAWLGLAWLGLAWLGLAWLGLAWLGLAWLDYWSPQKYSMRCHLNTELKFIPAFNLQLLSNNCSGCPVMEISGMLDPEGNAEDVKGTGEGRDINKSGYYVMLIFFTLPANNHPSENPKGRVR